jgi:arylsulfatase A-like enzyme
VRRLIAALVLALAACTPQRDDLPRHLVLISLDTLRADHLGLHGYRRDTSAALDRWSRGALVFEHAIAPSNATVASHHALLQSRAAGRALRGRDTAPTLAEWLREQGFRTAAFTGGGTLSRAAGFARGFDVWDEDNPALAQGLPKALRFLDEVAQGDARSFLFLHCFDVHLPYDPPAPFDRRFASADYRGKVSGPATLPLLRGVRRIFEQAHRASPPELDAADRAAVVDLYDGEIANMDSLLAQLLHRLDAPDLRERALVVILSDHGEEFWEHGSVLHAHTLYQELLHVPLVIRAPAEAGAPQRIAQRVSLLDVVPTALELLGVPAPPGLEGRSLRPLLASAAAPRPVFAEGFAFDARLQAVLAGDWKAIRDLGSGKLALYDLRADPGETRDVAAEHAEEVARMRSLLNAALGAAPAPQSPMPLPERVEPATEERLRALGYID